MSHAKTSAELEREIDARRLRIENKVDELAARLSPGQLLDEALRYTRNGPAADFVQNMGRSVVNNPIPVALLTASMAWLAVKPEGIHAADGKDHATAPRHNGHASSYDSYGYGRDELGEEYPVAAIKGSYMRRISVHPSTEVEGHSHTSFADEAGRTFKALTDSAGNRAGHFTDETGRKFRGFINEAGHRVSDFRDEADNRLHQATGWASHAWESASDRASRMGRQLRDGSQHLGQQARDAGQHLGHQARQAGRQLGHMYDDAGHAVRSNGGQAINAVDDFVHNQPLIGGAIAFAIGAVIAGMLPHTRQEDQAFGETADAVKRRAGEEAGHLYERGRDEAENLHERAREVAADLHDRARDVAAHAHDKAQGAAREQADKVTRH